MVRHGRYPRDMTMSTITTRDGTQIYEGFPHGMCTTHADTVNRDLLAFIRH